MFYQFQMEFTCLASTHMDMQPVSITYLCAYLSKIEDECSHAMIQTFKEDDDANCSNYEQMRLIACTCLSKREGSVQNAVYHIMPESWLQKTFPAVLFTNSNLKQNRYSICLKEAELEELPENSTYSFQKNMLDRYKKRPDSLFIWKKFTILDNMLCRILTYYHLK